MAAELTFSRFTLRLHERQLFDEGRPVALGARAFDVLSALVARAGELVSKSDLFDQVWPGVVVEENNLQVHISTLRKQLGAELIATIPGRGYRFTARVTPIGDAAASPPPASRLSARSIAVLPFTNLGGDPDQEYFSDGLAEDIIGKLTRSPWLHVIARNSSFAFRAPDVDLVAAARALGARYLTTGTVRRAGGTLRVSAELVDAQRNETLWAQRYDRPVADLFAIQSAISTQIVSAIEPVTLRREETLSSQSDAPPIAYWELLMRARWHFWRSSREHVDQARTCLAQALAQRPDDPSCLALLAFTHMTRVWAGWAPDPRDEVVEANRLALRAVRQDDTDSFAHFTLGTALSFTGNLPQAIAELRYALTLYPQFAAAAGELGRLLAFSGQTGEAMEYVLQAIDASPHDPHLSLWVRTRAIACFIEGRHDEAVRYAQEATAKRPDWFFHYYLLAACQSAAGQPDAALQSLQRAQAYGPYKMGALQAGHPFQDPAQLQRFTDLLRRVGWTG